MSTSGEVAGDTLPILHILVVGFHHQKGCTVEHAWPPLNSTTKEDSSLTYHLPPEWKYLPHLALPDGCHNYEQDSIFFVLPARKGMEESGQDEGTDEPGQAVYGVACCRQIDSDKVKPSIDVTRSTVQKSVCVLSKYPFYGSIEAKMNQVTEAYFEVKDFSKVSIFQDALTSLNSSFHLSKMSTDALQVGLSHQNEVLRFSHRLLQIIKALMLQKRVIICGSPGNTICKTIISIMLLFPKSLEAFVRSQGDKDEFGFPLRVFPSPLSVQPYICLQQMDLLSDESNKCLLVGVSNPLFQKQHSKYCDVYINMEDKMFDISDPKLAATLYLTSADLRFCDYVFRSVQDVASSTPSSAWFGSNGWVRTQYKLYILSLLSASLGGRDSKSLREFGVSFVEEWMKSPVFANWKLSSINYKGMSKIDPIHLCQGELTLVDLKLRMSAQASEYGLSDQSKDMIGQAWSRTQETVGSVGVAVGGAMGSAWSAASSAVSWWWTGSNDDN